MKKITTLMVLGFLVSTVSAFAGENLSCQAGYDGSTKTVASDNTSSGTNTTNTVGSDSDKK